MPLLLLARKRKRFVLGRQARFVDRHLARNHAEETPQRPAHSFYPTVGAYPDELADPGRAA